MLIRFATRLILVIALGSIPSVFAVESKTDDKDAVKASGAPSVRDRESAVGILLEHELPPKAVKWLEADGGKFLSLISSPPPAMKPLGAAIIVSGRQRTLNDPVIAALRNQLQHGAWISVAVQSPLVTSGEKPDAKAPDKLCGRLTSALAEIKNLQVTKWVLVGLDDGATSSLECFKDKLPEEIVAIASIADTALPDLTLPSILLRPELHQHAIAAPPARDIRKIEIVLNGSNTRYAGAEEEIARHIRGWLRQLPPPVQEAQGAAPKRNS